MDVKSIFHGGNWWRPDRRWPSGFSRGSDTMIIVNTALNKKRNGVKDFLISVKLMIH
jgi:hypothetical protein